MEVLYVEGVANHDGPESCAVVREGEREALTGGVWAGLLSREIVPMFEVLTCFPYTEGHAGSGVFASRCQTSRGRRTQARTKISMRGNREIPCSPVVPIDASSWMVRGVVDRCLRAVRGTP